LVEVGWLWVDSELDLEVQLDQSGAVVVEGVVVLDPSFVDDIPAPIEEEGRETLAAGLQGELGCQEEGTLEILVLTKDEELPPFLVEVLHPRQKE
jgi:hypothetical protein